MHPKDKTASEIHENVPPDWYYRSIRENIFQRFWHTRRFTEMRKLIEPAGNRVLDVGCADGMFTKVILDASHADEIIGIDVLETSVDWANKHWKDCKQLCFQVADSHHLPFDDNSFDAVTCFEMLEHVFDPKQVLSEFMRVLKPNGYAVLLVPTDNMLFRMIWAVWTRIRGKIWEGTHIQSFKGNALPHLAKEVGFVVECKHRFLLGMLIAVKVRKPYVSEDTPRT